MKRALPVALLITSLAVAVPLLHRQARHDAVLTRSDVCMGTLVTISVPPDRLSPAARMTAIDAAFDEMRRVESVFSAYDPASEIARVNARAAEAPVPVSRECFALIDEAVRYTRASGGAFDITIGPLLDLWRDAARTGSLPAAAALERARGRTGSHWLVLDEEGRTVAFARDGMSIDMSGMAKGHAVDRAVAVLRQRGIANALVDAGGDLYCLGRRSPGRLWRVGIRHPRGGRKLFYSFAAENRGVDTSGDYEQYAVISGRRYSHIIDPRSGHPTGDGVVSATAVAHDSMTADVFATALCVLGDEGLRTAEAAGVEAMIVTLRGGVLERRMTDGFREAYGGKADPDA